MICCMEATAIAQQFCAAPAGDTGSPVPGAEPSPTAPGEPAVGALSKPQQRQQTGNFVTLENDEHRDSVGSPSVCPGKPRSMSNAIGLSPAARDASSRDRAISSASDGYFRSRLLNDDAYESSDDEDGEDADSGSPRVIRTREPDLPGLPSRLAEYCRNRSTSSASDQAGYSRSFVEEAERPRAVSNASDGYQPRKSIIAPASSTLAGRGSGSLRRAVLHPHFALESLLPALDRPPPPTGGEETAPPSGMTVSPAKLNESEIQEQPLAKDGRPASRQPEEEKNAEGAISEDQAPPAPIPTASSPVAGLDDAPQRVPGATASPCRSPPKALPPAPSDEGAREAGGLRREPRGSPDASPALRQKKVISELQAESSDFHHPTSAPPSAVSDPALIAAWERLLFADPGPGELSSPVLPHTPSHGAHLRRPTSSSPPAHQHPHPTLNP
eukprot:RCo029873